MVEFVSSYLSDIQKRVEEIVKRFQYFESWEDRYRQLIHYGKRLPPLLESLKTDDHLVPGCVSRVWICHKFEKGKIFFQGDSDASITKGIIGVFFYVYSGGTPEGVFSTSPNFMGLIGLRDHLSPNRRNGLASVEKVIRGIAQGYLEG